MNDNGSLSFISPCRQGVRFDPLLVAKTALMFMLFRTDSLIAAAPTTSPWPHRLPGWGLARGRDVSESDAAFAAAIALKSLDDLIRADPPWLGCWRDRLALKSAAVAARMHGRNGEENNHRLELEQCRRPLPLLALPKFGWSRRTAIVFGAASRPRPTPIRTVDPTAPR